jgi:L-asparaginase II
LSEPEQFVPVAVARRSGLDESIHWGAVVALAADGSIAWSAGDPEVVIYPRSALKPLQAAAMMAAGLVLDDRQLAIAGASHDGRPEHVAIVREILAAVGLREADLENTPTMPIDEEARHELIRGGAGPASILQNCSGKHAAMLATCVVNGWPTAGYVAVDHPVQQLIDDHIAVAAGGVAHVGVDGCGAPTAAISLVGLARAVRRLALDDHAVYRAMVAHPALVGGPTREVTQLMQAAPGLLVKDGADGVYVAAMPDGRAVATKIADGGDRARRPVLVAALASLGIDAGAPTAPVFGHGRPVGEVRSLVPGGAR